MECVRECYRHNVTDECDEPGCVCEMEWILLQIRECVLDHCPDGSVGELRSAVAQNCGSYVANNVVSTRPSRTDPTPTPVPDPPSSSTRTSARRTEVTRPASPPTLTTSPRPIAPPTRLTRSATTRTPTSSSAAAVIASPKPITSDHTLAPPGEEALQPTQDNEPSSLGFDENTALANPSAEVDIDATDVVQDSALSQIQPEEADTAYAYVTTPAGDRLLTFGPGGDAQDSRGAHQTVANHLTSKARESRIPNTPAPSASGGLTPERASKDSAWIAGTVAGVIAALGLLALFGFCMVRRRNRRAAQTQNENSVVTAVGGADAEDEWTKFDTETPVREKPGISEHLHQDKVIDYRAKDAEEAEDAPKTIASPIASTMSDQSDHKLYSHYQEIMPPPSMRSKRYSRGTVHTLKSDGSGYEYAHPSDSQSHLPYPFERPPSSLFSLGTALPSLLFDAAKIPYQAQSAPTSAEATAARARAADLGSAQHAQATSGQSVHTLSRRSTISNASLSTSGRGETFGRAL